MSESELQRLINAAGLADEAGDYPRAAHLLEEAARIPPMRAALWAWLGDVYAQMQKYSIAEDAFGRAIQLDTSSAGAHSGLGRVLQETGRDADAAHEFMLSIDLDPTSSRRVLLARSLAALGDLRAAESALRRALDDDSENTDALIALAQLVRAQDQEEALALVNRALAVAPKDSVALRELGGLLAERGQLADAVKVLRDSEREDPRDSWTKVYLGNALESLGLLSESEQSFNQAAEASPLSGTILLFVSDYYQRRGYYDSAEEALRRAVSLEPDNAAVAQSLAGLLRATGRGAEAQSWSETARALDERTKNGGRPLGGATD